MSDMNFYRPETIADASGLMVEKKENARLIAGGTDLVGTIREQILPCEISEVISLKSIDELKGTCEADEYIEIGAMETLDALDKNEDISKTFPLLSKAAKTVASPQIRHVATLGGNICQEPRCWYYRYHDNKFNCLRKGGDRCNAVVGNNIYHSIFGPSKVCDTPCEVHCPNHTNIPAYMECIRKGDVEGAAHILFSVNPLAAVTGRICPHTCEQYCNRKKYDESVSIREVERYLGDFILANPDRFITAPAVETGKKITIVGAGPAGLTSAFFLRSQGHSVTIVDKNENVGGMLYYGIPAYRLPKDILAKIKAILEGIGVVFKMGVKVGIDVSMQDLSSESDVLFIGIGAWVSLNLNFAGNDAKGVLNALEFLYKVAEHQEQEIGKKVVVIGGGNTSFDVCRSALKMGAEEVTLLSILPYDEMPAEEDEITEAEKEGVTIRELTTLKEVIKDENGAVSKLILQKMAKKDEEAEGLENIIAIDGDTVEISADNVIVAIGQGIDAKGFDAVSSVGKRIDLADKEAGKTAIDDIFAAGDAAHGPATVVKSIYQARTTADTIHASLIAGEGAVNTREKAAISFSERALHNSQRVKPAELPIEERNLYTEISKTIDELGFGAEAERCLNCGCVAVTPSDTATALVALNADVVTNMRVVPAERFFDTPVMGSTVLTEGEIVTSVRIPKETAGNQQIYFKHRTRKSIDFPILGIAINAQMDGNLVKDIHIAFGAVAPVPKKMYEVEAFLRGKTLTDEIIRTASELAVKDCLPLAENQYKINLLKVLFRRNLEGLKK